MEFEDFYKGQKVIYTPQKSWGTGVVTTIFNDYSLLVLFTDRSVAKFEHTNMFRYYKQELENFKEA